MKRELSWWRLLVGLPLVYITLKFLLFPETRTVQPSSTGEAYVMLMTDVVVLAVGFLLLITCYRRPLAARNEDPVD